MLTKTQINKLNKAKKNGVGSDIKISKAQISKIAKHGGIEVFLDLSFQ